MEQALTSLGTKSPQQPLFVVSQAIAYARVTITGRLAPWTCRFNRIAMVTIAVAGILSSKDQLTRAVDELSKNLDAVGHKVDALGDTDPRTGIVHAAKLNRERLTKAVLELSQAFEKLSALQPKLVEAAARRRG
jgi:hypothetical protein